VPRIYNTTGNREFTQKTSRLYKELLQMETYLQYPSHRSPSPIVIAEVSKQPAGNAASNTSESLANLGKLMQRNPVKEKVIPFREPISVQRRPHCEISMKRRATSRSTDPMSDKIHRHRPWAQDMIIGAGLPPLAKSYQRHCSP
jgi:hypothetical protein